MTVLGRDCSRDRHDPQFPDASFAHGQPVLRIVQQHVDPDAVIEQRAELVGAVEPGGLARRRSRLPTCTTRPGVRFTAARISGTQRTPSTLV